MINNAIAKLALFMALGLGLVNPEYAKANNNLAQCFDNNVKYQALAHYEAEKSNYYLVDIIFPSTGFQRNVIEIDNTGNCSAVVENNEMDYYPLSNFVSQEIAYNLLTSRYLTLIKQYGGKEAFTEALLGELDADAPHNFFEDAVIVLKRLGIDLAEETPNLVIVGEEGIPGNPHLQHLQ